MLLELDIEKIKRMSQQKENENYRFRSFLKGQDDEKVDRIVYRLHKDISGMIDCTTCGNCCTKLKPAVTNPEIKRLSVIDSVLSEYFRTNFTEQDDFKESLYLKDTPCKYLLDKKCLIYAERPDVCKSYPHTHLPDFNSRTLEVIENTAICPIVFNLFEQLKREFGFRSI
jgi:Fe-S-cluster containining protein